MMAKDPAEKADPKTGAFDVEFHSEDVPPEFDNYFEQLRGGNATASTCKTQVLLRVDDEIQVLSHSGTGDDREELSDLTQKVFAASECTQIKRAMREAHVDLVLSIDMGDRLDRDSMEGELAVAFYFLELKGIGRAIELALLEGIWTFHCGKVFVLTFIPCHSRSEDNTEESMLERIRNQYKTTQTAREVIDSQRQEWLHSDAEPLLDDIENELSKASLLSDARKELFQLHKSLRHEAYGFSDLIETSELESLLGKSLRRAREFSKEGRLGLAFSRTYVHSRKEAERFAKKERKPGRPPSS